MTLCSLVLIVSTHLRLILQLRYPLDLLLFTLCSPIVWLRCVRYGAYDSCRVTGPYVFVMWSGREQINAERHGSAAGGVGRKWIYMIPPPHSPLILTPYVVLVPVYMYAGLPHCLIKLLWCWSGIFNELVILSLSQ